MANIYEKAQSVPNICGIEIAFSGRLIPSTIEGYQIFNNSLPNHMTFHKAYGSKTSFNFDEQSETTNAGISYKQKFVLRFPNADGLRSDRIALWHKVKFVKIKLTNNKHIIIGRNDFEQNARPKIVVKSTEKAAQVEFETDSIFPSGYIPNPNISGLPDLIPIDLINED